MLNYLARGRSYLATFKGDDEEEEEVQQVVAYLKDVELLTGSTPDDKALIRNLIERRKLIDRQIPSHLFQVKEVGSSLTQKMCMVVVLFNMTAIIFIITLIMLDMIATIFSMTVIMVDLITIVFSIILF